MMTGAIVFLAIYLGLLAWITVRSNRRLQSFLDRSSLLPITYRQQAKTGDRILVSDEWLTVTMVNQQSDEVYAGERRIPHEAIEIIA